ncbi:hypothetical protein [Paractinoplanes globisporus]|uniref:Uncharacterized protein n=1 Tax=Paractinoplanes globisporus TaxID=113565 RepID=A0ABW6WF11_9ACTN|nr:hypothetical protein [Actinoplanes globisporus]
MGDGAVNAAINELTGLLVGAPQQWVAAGGGASWPIVSHGDCVVSTWENELVITAAFAPSTMAATALVMHPRLRRPRVVDLGNSSYATGVQEQVTAFVRRHSIGGLLPLGIWFDRSSGQLQVVLDVNRVFGLTNDRPEDRAIMLAFLNEQTSIFYPDADGGERYWQVPQDQALPLDRVINESVTLNS